METPKSHPMTSSLLQSFVAACPHYAFLKDTDSRYLACNADFAHLVGLSDPKDIVGRTDYELAWQIPGDQAAFFRQGDQAALSGKPLTNQQESLILPGKPSRVVCVNKRPLYNAQDQVIGLLGIARDITEEQEMVVALQKAQAAAKIAQQAKTDFLANIAHDLRTPLSGIMGMTAALDFVVPPGKQKPLVEMLQTAHEQLMVRINQLIDYIATQHDQSAQSSRFDTAHLIKELRGLCSPAAAQKQLTLDLKTSSDLPAFLVGDVQRISTLLLQLLNNAIEFTPAGFVRLELSFEALSHEEHRGQLRCCVSDSGVGMTPEQQAHIFEPFKRVKPAYQHDTPGMGLGLSLVQEHLTALGGSITVESTPGKGSCFTCLLPIRIPKDSEPHITRVLLVEDNQIAQMAAQSLLEPLGCRVDIAASIPEALTALKDARDDYHWILMDIGLPEGSGIELTQQILSDGLVSKNTPIIALSAHMHRDLETQCISAGMQEIYTKPLRLEQAQDLVKRYGAPQKQSEPLIQGGIRHTSS